MTKEYSCVKKTKNSFEKALVELSKEQPLNKITVKSLCERAQLSRNAFYFHYKDISDLVETMEIALADSAVELLNGMAEIGFPKNVYATVEGLVELICRNRDACGMLFENTPLIDRLSLIFCEFNYQYFTAFHGDSKRTRFEYFYRFISGGFYGVLSHWIKNPNQMSKAELTAMLYILIKRLIILDNPDIEGALRGTK